MKAISKGVLVVLTTLSLWGIACKAKADEVLDGLLLGKQVVYVGTCWFRSDGVLTFKSEERKRVEQCVVGMALPDTTKHYVLVVTARGPKELLVYDETKKVQRQLWYGGASV